MGHLFTAVKLLVLAVLLVPCAQAAGLNSTNYVVYSKSGALYIVPKKIVLIIFSDVDIPIAFTPAVPAFRVETSTGALSAITLTASNLKNDASYSLVGYKVHQGDFNGDGNTDLFLQAPNASSDSYVLIPSLPMAESLSDLTRGDIFEVRISDQNVDGRADINIYRDGVYVRTLIASSTGDFIADDGDEGEDSKKASINICWNQFRAAMLANNRAEMEKSIHFSSMARFSNIFDELGNQIPQIAAQMGAMKPLEIRGNVATYLVEKQGDNGSLYIHTVTFVRTWDGSWKLLQL